MNPASLAEEQNMNEVMLSMEVRRNAQSMGSSAFVCLILLIWCSTVSGQSSGEAKSSAGTSSIRATHIMGFEDASNNASGNLSITASTLQFQKGSNTTAQINISSIQDVLLGEEDKQVGGVPMTLGKAATPFGGGRVVGLFSHKKYDTLTLEYVDGNGGFHGAIFRLAKGQGQTLKSELVTNGAHVGPVEDKPASQSASEVKNENK
jgi:hypothetical protein